MNRERSPEALFEEALIERRGNDARTCYDMMAQKYGNNPPIIFHYHAARVAFASDKVKEGLAELENWRKADCSPFGLLLSIKALTKFRVEKKLAETWIAALSKDLEVYSPTSSDDLPRSYYETEISDLRHDILSWQAD